MCEIAANVDALFVHMLAERFAAELRDWLKPWEWKEMQRDNATPHYAGDTICASHNHCDANMAMLEAFEDVLKREVAFSEDEAQNERDFNLIGPAWSIAKRLYLTEGAA